MYRFLRSHLPRRLADLAMALWLALLVVLVLYCAFEPYADFKYLML